MSDVMLLCRFCHSKKGCWAWQCYKCGEIDDVQQPTPPAVQRPWQGLTQEEIWKGLTDADWSNIMDRRDTALDTFQQGAVWAADILKKRNG